jgi:hypothetical protein
MGEETQVGGRVLRPVMALLIGLFVLAVGLALLVDATVAHDPRLAVLAMIGSGVGYGLIFRR